MRIEGIFPSYFSRVPQAAALPKPDAAPSQNSLYNPPIVVEISPEGREAYNRTKVNDGASKIGEVFEPHECQTCKNRKYQDSSSDPSVSFQAPTHISPGQAGSAVASHEGEHVAHEQAKAEREGRKIVSQTVSLQTSICPECGRVYISGGVTRTITANKQDMAPKAPEENNT